MDSSNGDIEMFDPKSPESTRLQNEMDGAAEDNPVKNLLKKKWNSYREKEKGENSQL